MKIYDYWILRKSLDLCECGNIPGILCLKGSYEFGDVPDLGCVLVVECEQCGKRGEEGRLWKAGISWNLGRRNDVELSDSQ
jgi:hypothetical protein